MNPTSFVCERSAEYMLVPQVIEALRNKFRYVVPIYPWISREGGKISKLVNGSYAFKVLGLYPRRPKLLPNDERIIVKFSEQIIYGAKAGQELGIPIIAGCPLAKSFWELSECEDFLWADLAEFNTDDIDYCAVVNARGVIAEEPEGYFFKDISRVSEIIDRSDKHFNISTFIDAIKEIKMRSRGAERYIPMYFMGGYKPVYFLLANP
ncbi:hypothetical protein [Salinivibrio kushneri]|uniref:hypothetical protein n=1 Tax=Salinivibrio kushneri TaxID=1908198 RepID=UPI0010541C48|nr:hypothetical protein [Salinivibrio kushneri]